MIPGKATPEGTAAYAKGQAAHKDHWRSGLGLTLSSLGMGSYLGNADPLTDAKYAEALVRAVASGINVIDSAINYRYQRSERNLGQGLRRAIEKRLVTRDQVLLCTKGGFIAGDMGPPSKEWFEETFVKPGIVGPGDFVAGCHCMAPKYVRHEVEQSLKNFDVAAIDVYYLHNPETQMPEVGEKEYYARLTAAFRELEACVAEGKIQVYGTATWNAHRVPAGEESWVSLEKTLACAVEAGGPSHHFKVLQLPFNFGLPEAYVEPVQTWGGNPVTALEAASEAGLKVFTSVPLMQGKLLGRFAAGFREKFPGLSTDAQRCLQFARSTPGVAAPLCGMKDAAHVEENAGVRSVAPFTVEEFQAAFGKSG